MVLKEIKSYRFDTEEEVTTFLEELKVEAETKGYQIGSYKSTKKVKKAKGEIIAECTVLDVTFIYADLWEDLV